MKLKAALLALALAMSAREVALCAPLLPVPVSTVPASNGDLNPYGVTFVSGNPGGNLQFGDLLVSNFNNSSNLTFLGTTIVDIRNGAQTAAPFYTATAEGEGLSLALGQLGNFIIVGNVPRVGFLGGPGALTVLDGWGNVVNTLSDPTGNFIDGPWGLAIHHRFRWGWGIKSFESQIFVSNLFNGSVWRLDVGVDAKKGVAIENAVRVGNGYASIVNFPALANGPAGLAYDPDHDILYVASEFDNEIFAIDDASRIANNQSTPGTVVYSDALHLHGPAGLLLLRNGDLLTANSDGVNVNQAEPSELVEFTPGAPNGTFVTQFSVDPAPGGAFGIALARRGDKAFLAYVDDNTATVSVLSLFATSFDQFR